MILLDNKQLEYSSVVANNRMNRERQAFGINSYEKDLGFKLIDFLEKCLAEHETVRWMDLCCGKGNALIQGANYFYNKNQIQLCIEGWDLAGIFSEKPSHLDFLKLWQKSVAEWQPAMPCHLITCVHGLHYVGDKLKVIETALQNLTPQGIFLANLDLENVKITGKSVGSLKKIFQKKGLQYNKKHILSGTYHKNPDFGLEYLGADDSAGPNYTGQEAVNSYYTVKNQ
jgi:SAM-dependent methyltransferase